MFFFKNKKSHLLGKSQNISEILSNIILRSYTLSDIPTNTDEILRHPHLYFDHLLAK